MAKFDIHNDILGFCVVCGRPYRSKNIRRGQWMGRVDAVTGGAKGMCGGCYIRGGEPPKSPEKTNHRHLPEAQRVAKSSPSGPQGTGIQRELGRVHPVSTAEARSVIASAATRLGSRGAREVAEMLGLISDGALIPSD